MDKQWWGRLISRGLTPLFLLTFFWQTRVVFFDKHQIIDYLIPFIYLTDILLVLLLVAEFLVSPGWLWERFRDIGIYGWLWLVGLMIVVGVVLGVDQSVGAFYRIWRLVLMFGLSLWVVQVLPRWGAKHLIRLITVGLLPLVLVGLVEVLRGQSLGLHMIGEWNFSMNTPGIAKTMVMGSKILRAYSTFPHPNVFGGIVAVFLMWELNDWLDQANQAKTIRFLRRLSLIILLIGVVVAFSRAVWLAVLLGASLILTRSLVSAFRQQVITRIEGVGVLLVGVVLVNLLISQSLGLLQWDQITLDRRLALNKVAVQMWLDHFWLGVGQNQFILQLDRYWQVSGLTRFMQPVHNVLLLILVESGAVAGILWLVSLIGPVWQAWSRLSPGIRASWVIILITGMVDHYWWTLPAGQLVLFLTWGLTLATMVGEDGAIK